MRHLRTVTSQRPYGANIIVKMADCGSDVEFKNDKHCAYDENNWRLTLGVFDWAVSWSTLKSWSTFRIRLVLHEISWSTKDVSRNSGDIFREVNHVMALLRQLRRCSSRQVLQILINSK